MWKKTEKRTRNEPEFVASEAGDGIEHTLHIKFVDHDNVLIEEEG